MEGDYENASHIKPPAYTETNDTVPQVMQQPAAVPEAKELNSNSNVNAGYYDIPPQWVQQPTSIPDKLELDSNSNENTGHYDVLSNVMQEPATISDKSELEKKSHTQGNSQVIASSGEDYKSNTQGEGTTVFLQFNELWTAPGIMMIINIVLLFIGWCVIVGWKSLDENNWRTFYDEALFFLSTTLLPFLISATICFLILCGAHKRIDRGNWELALMVHFGLASLLLMSASIVLAVKVQDIKDKENGWKIIENWCDYRKCRLLHTGYSFGIMAAAGLFVQAVLHLIEFIRSKSNVKCQCC